MSSRQQRELAMRNDMIGVLVRFASITRAFVHAQELLADGDFAGDRFQTLERALGHLLALPWAKALLDDNAAAWPPAGPGPGAGTPQ